MKNKIRSKRIALIMTIALLLQVFAYSGAIRTMAVTDIFMEDYEDIIGTYNIDDSIPSYNDYHAAHADAATPDRTIVVGEESVVRYEESGAPVQPVTAAAGDSAGVLTSEDSLIEFEVDIPETGLYNMSLEYYPTEGKNSDIERAIFIDG